MEECMHANGMAKDCAAVRPNKQLLAAAVQLARRAPMVYVRPPWLADDIHKLWQGEGGAQAH